LSHIFIFKFIFSFISLFSICTFTYALFFFSTHSQIVLKDFSWHSAVIQRDGAYVIAVSTGLLDDLDDEELSFVLAKELAHMQAKMNKYSLFSDLMVSMCFAFSLTFLVPLCKV
jgi:hypothetical protein